MSVTMIGIERAAHTSGTATSFAKVRGRRQRGNVLLEQALVLPVMMLLMFGVIDMARALYTYHYVSYIAREATRWASVRSTIANGGPVDQGDVGNFVKDVSGMGLDSTKFTTALAWIAPANLSPLCPGGLANNNTNRKPGCVVQVTVKYNFKFIVPIMPAGFTMTSESQMIITQ
jgi:Flp pilus assembly protein TadG